MTTTEDFWKGILVVLNISVWLGRLRNVCNSVFLHVWSKSPEHPFCIFELCDCFNSSISDLQDSHLFLKLHQQVQKQLSSYNDLPFNKIQQITIITTAHTDFPRYSNTVLKFNLVILTQFVSENCNLHNIPFPSKHASPPWEHTLAPLHQTRGKHHD